MKQKANYKGRKFGLLTVINCIEASNGHNEGGLWMCKCKCKKFVNVRGYQLHHRESCGCMVKKAAIERGKNNRRSGQEKELTLLYQKYKRLNLVHADKNTWMELKEKPCVYCGDIGQTIVTINNTWYSVCINCGRNRKYMPHESFCDYIHRCAIINRPTTIMPTTPISPL